MLSIETFNEQQLTSLLKEGNEDAFVEIYRRNWRSMFNAAYRRLEDEKQCEDLVQNIFVDLWERRQLVEIINLSAYLATAVRFQVIKYATRVQSTSPFIEQFENILISPFKSEDALLDAEIAEVFTLWIDALPEKRREAFIMYYIDGRSTSDIAENLGITQKTVQNQIASASARIRQQLAKTLCLIYLLSFPFDNFQP